MLRPYWDLYSHFVPWISDVCFINNPVFDQMQIWTNFLGFPNFPEFRKINYLSNSGKVTFNEFYWMWMHIYLAKFDNNKDCQIIFWSENENCSWNLLKNIKTWHFNCNLQFISVLLSQKALFNKDPPGDKNLISSIH
jgi:hypothetical protein